MHDIPGINLDHFDITVVESNLWQCLLVWQNRRLPTASSVTKRRPIVEATATSMNVVSAGTGSYPQAFHANRYANPRLGEIEAEWTRRNRFSNVEWQLRPRPKASPSSRENSRLSCRSGARLSNRTREQASALKPSIAIRRNVPQKLSMRSHGNPSARWAAFRETPYPRHPVFKILDITVGENL